MRKTLREIYATWKELDNETLETIVLPRIRILARMAHERGEIYLWFFFACWEKKIKVHLTEKVESHG